MNTGSVRHRIEITVTRAASADFARHLLDHVDTNGLDGADVTVRAPRLRRIGPDFREEFRRLVIDEHNAATVTFQVGAG